MDSRGFVWRRWALPAVLLLALAIRVVIVLITSHGWRPQTDAIDYWKFGLSLATTAHFPASYLDLGTHGPTAFRGPLYPILVAVTLKLVGVHAAHALQWQALRLEEALLETLAVYLVFKISDRLWNRQIAFTAAILTAVCPTLLLAGCSILSEPLFIVLVLASVLAGLRFRARPRLRGAVLTGVLIGLAEQTRTEGLFLFVPLTVMVWRAYSAHRVGAPGRRAAWRAPVALLAALLVTMTPWTIRNSTVFHQFVPLGTEGGYALGGTYNWGDQAQTRFPALWYHTIPALIRDAQQHRHMTEAQLSDQLTADSIAYIKAHPRSVPRVIYWSARRMFDLTGLEVERWDAPWEVFPISLVVASGWAIWAILLVILAGLALPKLGPEIRKAARRAGWAFWACPSILLLANLPIAGLTRYRLPIDPFLLMLVAVVGVSAWQALRPAPVKTPTSDPPAPDPPAAEQRVHV